MKLRKHERTRLDGWHYLRLFVALIAVVVFLEGVVRPLKLGPGATAAGILAALPVAWTAGWAFDRVRRLLE